MSPSPNRIGHTPILIACFLHFDVCFMLWVLVGALGVFIAESAGLDAAQKGLLVAIPVADGLAAPRAARRAERSSRREARRRRASHVPRHPPDSRLAGRE